jgi:hypothetical protein
MRNFFRRRHLEPAIPGSQDVSQPMPLSNPPTKARRLPNALREPADDITVSELSELEARALCTSEGIPVFWPKHDRDKGG